MPLYLIRHPRPAVAAGLCYGSSDLDLAEAVGPLAAGLRARLPAGLPLYSSPLTRCRLLAAALHPAPVLDERLREMDFGRWEMQPWHRIERTALEAWAADPLGFAPPGGEAPGDLLARVGAFLAALDSAGVSDAVIVCHAGVMKAAHGLRQQLPAAAWMRLEFAYGELAVLA